MVNNLVVAESESFEVSRPNSTIYSNSFTRHDKAANTINAYASDWQDFTMWCSQRNCSFMPANPCDVADYLEDRAKNKWNGISGKNSSMTEKEPLKWNSLQRRLSSISKIHQYNELPFDRKHPSIAKTLNGIKRILSKHSTSQIEEERKSPILTTDIIKMIEALPQSLAGARDRAILLIGFAGAFRRSEISGICIEHLTFFEHGVEVMLPWSKTGPRKTPITLGSSLLTCPITALRNWIQLAGIVEGPVFVGINRHGKLQKESLSDRAIALIIQNNAYLTEKVNKAKEKAQQDPTIAIPDFGGHSLRSGFATTAILNKVPEHLIMAQGCWKKSDTMKKYIRETNRWSNNASLGLGL